MSYIMYTFITATDVMNSKKWYCYIHYLTEYEQMNTMFVCCYKKTVLPRVPAAPISTKDVLISPGRSPAAF